MKVSAAFHSVFNLVALREDELLVGETRFFNFINLLVLILAVCWAQDNILFSFDLGNPKTLIAIAVLLVALQMVFVKPESKRFSLGALFCLGFILTYVEFPNAPNHRLLELVVLFMAWMTNAKVAAERRLFFSFVRGFALLILFYAGIQKVLLGTYFSGQYLAYKTYMAPRFRPFAFFWCNTEEFNTLTSLRWPPYAGLAGFKLKTWYGLLVSNATWVLEVLLPFLVLFARWRSFWVLVTIVFVGLFQLAALELEFFLVMAILLALFFEKPYEKALFGCSVVLLVLNVVLLGDY